MGAPSVQQSDRKIQQDKMKQPMNYTTICVLTGFWGGLSLGTFGFLTYLLHFTPFGPAVVFLPWASGNGKDGMLWEIAGIFVISLLSIIAALVYRFTLVKWYSMWVGAGFGVAVWGIVFFLYHFLAPSFPRVANFDLNTFFTTLCLYLLYGVFIGYSLSFNYHELNTPSRK